MNFSIEPILGAFPAFRCGVVLAEIEVVPEGRAPMLDAAVTDAELDARTRYDLETVAEIPAIRDWRKAYRAMGIRKTSYRCSVERLLRGVLQGRGLPRVNGFVDAYNLASLRHLAPLGADDLDRVSGDIGFRYARPDDSFIALGDESATEDPPKDGEVVYADGTKLLCRRWNWYQDARSPITLETRRAIVTVQGLGAADVDAAVADLRTMLAEHAGTRSAAAILDIGDPTVDLETLTP
ncbi:MAG: phenylalanine--tRNA ligase beta subunit-related protein [Dongiaceae bacterium]